MLALCLSGHSVSAFAADTACVDDDTLQGFYEKFSLLEKEKEALRDQLASCSTAKPDNSLSIPLSQKEGRQLRYLESKITQLEEENKTLKDKLKTYEPGAADDNKDGDSEPQKDDTEDESESEEKSGDPIDSPVLPVPREKPENHSSPEISPAQEPPVIEFAPEPADDKETGEKKSGVDRFDKIETGSGANTDSAAFPAQDTPSSPVQEITDSAEITALTQRCTTLFSDFGNDVSRGAHSENERKTFADLISSLQDVLILHAYTSLPLPAASGEKVLCPTKESADFAESTVHAIKQRLKSARSAQEKIQILYQEKVKLETEARKRS